MDQEQRQDDDAYENDDPSKQNEALATIAQLREELKQKKKRLAESTQRIIQLSSELEDETNK